MFHFNEGRQTCGFFGHLDRLFADLGGRRHQGIYPALQLYGYGTKSSEVPASYKSDSSRTKAEGVNIHTAPDMAASS